MSGWTYPAVVAAPPHDGDTIYLDLDMGLSVWMRKVRLRLRGINARELTQPGGPNAQVNLAQMLPVGSPLTAVTVKSGKYDYEAVVTLPDGSDLATVLVQGGWAAQWDGTGAKPLPPWPRGTA